MDIASSNRNMAGNDDDMASTTLPTALNHEITRSRKILLMTVVVFLGLVNSFGGGTVLIGPRVQADLGFSTNELQWLSTSFYIPLGCFSLMSGKLADVYGGKRTCLVGMTLNTLASLGACFTTSKEGLYVTRGISGLGGSLSTVAGYPIIVGIFEEGTGRTFAMAIYVAAWPTGGALALIVSGFFAEPDWHRFFYLSTGLLAVSGLTILMFVPDQKTERNEHTHFLREIDVLGGFLVIAGLVLLFYVLTVAPGASRGWATPYVLALLVIGVGFLVLFAVWQRYLEKKDKIVPLVPLGVFALDGGRTSLLLLIAMLCFAGYSGWMFLLTLYLEVYLKLSLEQTALHLLPGPIAGIACNIVIGFIANRVATHWILSTGAFSTGVSLILFATMPVDATYWSFMFFATILTVLGADCAGSAGIIHITKIMTGHRAGLAGGLYGTFIQLGCSLGPSLATLGLRYIAQAHAHDQSSVPYDNPSFPASSYLYGLQRASWILAALCLFAGILVPVAMHRQTKPSHKNLEDIVKSEDQNRCSSNGGPDREKDIEASKCI